MAMTLDTAIKFTAKLEGTGLDQLKRNLQGLSQQSNVSKRSLDQLYTATQKLGQASGNTVGGLQKYAASLRALRDQAEFGSRSFKLLSRDLETVEGKLRRFQGAASGQGGLSGGLGGLGGVLAGVTTYFSAQKATELAGTAASFGALQGQLLELNKAAGLTNQTAQTLAQDGLGAVIAASRASGVPIENLSGQLLKLTAAAQGTIFQGAELNKVFIAINRYAAAFGLSVDDTDGIIRAFQQTLSKQKLSLEEINGQFGDRAPTALRVFAEAARMNVPEFTKAVADGKLTVNDLVDLLPALSKQTEMLESTMSPLKKAQKELNAEMAQAGLVIGRTLEPAVTGITKTLAGFLKSFNEGNTNLVKGLAIAAGTIGGVAVAWLAVTAAARTAAIAQAAAASFGQALKTGKGMAGLLMGGAAAIGGGILASQLFKGLDEEVAKAKKELDKLTNLNLDKDYGQGNVSGSNQAAMDAAKKRLAEELKIREDTEKRLADFREQSLRRAADLERDLGDQRKELERSIAEARTRIARQQEDRDLERQRRQLRAQGLGTEGVDAAARVRDIMRRLQDQTLQAQQNATDRKIQLERTLGDYQLSVARGISEILQDAADKMAKKMAAGGQAAVAAMTGGPMPAGSFIARTGNTGDTTGPHLDARWADGRRITAADADRYLSVNGRDPSSYGVTSGYGPRRMFGRSFHAGMDFGTPTGSGISLKGGASLLRDLGFTGAGGYAVEIMTPEGPMRLLHLQGGSVAAGGGGGAPLATPGVDAAGKRLSKLLGVNQGLQVQAAQGDAAGALNADLSQVTSQLDDQLKSSTEQLRNYERMVQLERSGLSPELAKQRADLESMARTELTALQQRGQELQLERQKTTEGSTQRQLLDDAIRLNDQAILRNSGIVDEITRQNQQLERQQQIQERNKQLTQGIANSIGQGIGSAIDLLISGTDNWGNSLKQIAAGVLKDIARQIAQTLVIQPIINAIGSIKFANGGIMTGDGPVQLRRYAGGGIASSPQLAMFGEGSMPEAYVPLPDGRRIPVAMKGGGGGTTVNVSVDAKGTSVQGDGGRSEQLGRVVAQAVQAELIRQKRPGGLIAA